MRESGPVFFRGGRPPVLECRKSGCAADPLAAMKLRYLSFFSFLRFSVLKCAIGGEGETEFQCPPTHNRRTTISPAGATDYADFVCIDGSCDVDKCCVRKQHRLCIKTLSQCFFVCDDFHPSGLLVCRQFFFLSQDTCKRQH